MKQEERSFGPENASGPSNNDTVHVMELKSGDVTTGVPPPRPGLNDIGLNETALNATGEKQYYNSQCKKWHRQSWYTASLMSHTSYNFAYKTAYFFFSGSSSVITQRLLQSCTFTMICSVTFTLALLFTQVARALPRACSVSSPPASSTGSTYLPTLSPYSPYSTTAYCPNTTDDSC